MRRQAVKGNQQGFTIIETIVVVFAAAIIILVLLNLFVRHGTLYGLQQASVNVTGDSRRALNEMQFLVVQANRVLASHTFSGTSYSSGVDTLVLQIPAIDSSGVVITGIWDYAAFYVHIGKLYRVLEAGAGSIRTPGTILLSGSLYSMTFTYDNADFALVQQVDADIQTQEVARPTTARTRAQQRMRLRNY